MVRDFDKNPISPDKKDRLISLMKSHNERSEDSGNGWVKGKVNRALVLKYKDVILESLEKKIPLREIHKFLIDLEGVKMAERTFYRLCTIYVMPKEEININELQNSKLEVIKEESINKAVNEYSPDLNKEDSEDTKSNPMVKDIHKNNGLSKNYIPNNNPNMDDIVFGKI